MISTKFSPHVEISFDNLIHNVNQIRSAISDSTGILAVVKDNAYGCGSVPIANALEKYCKVNAFAVARPEEAFALRDHSVKGMILVLGRATPEQIEIGIQQNITFTLTDLAEFEQWKECKGQITFHCLIDTGMHRMGLLPSQIPELIKILATSNKFHLDGVFTHLANADELNTKTVDRQRDIFFKCINQLKAQGISLSHVHYGNSAGLMCFPMKECTMVRPGIALYGGKPDPKRDFCLDLRPVLSLKTSVVKLKKVPAGTPVSYGGNYVTPRETFIATVAVGYGQGLPRCLGNKGNILINGIKYSIAGNVTMDYVMIDAGPDPQIKVGDEAVAIGVQGKEQITPDDIAKISNTISYEILCNVGTSIERFYLLNDSIVLHTEGQIY